jgi:hypothetical protein
MEDAFEPPDVQLERGGPSYRANGLDEDSAGDEDDEDVEVDSDYGEEDEDWDPSHATPARNK